MKRLTVVGLLVSIGLLFWALRDVSLHEMAEHLRAAHPGWLFACVVTATLTFHLRAIRWRVLLHDVDQSIPFGSRYAAVCIGFMVNNVLPARVGEVARAYSLSRIASVSMSGSLASLLVERLLDAIILTIFLVPAFFLAGVDAEASNLLRTSFTVVVIVVAVGLISLGLLVRFPDRALTLVERWCGRLGRASIAERLKSMVTAFGEGLGALRHAHVMAKAVLWTFVVWGWNGLSFYLGFVAFGIVGPGFEGALTLQSTISFAVAIPSTPGFFGPFESATRLALELHQIEPSRIIGFAAGYHILTFLPVTILGLWFMRRVGMRLGDFGAARK